MQNLSPLEGRYSSHVAPLRPFLSEEAYYRYRLHVEIEWLIHQTRHPQLRHARQLSPAEEERVRRVLSNLDLSALLKVEARTKHDVKAIELYLGGQLDKAGLGELVPAVHFACTSEDISSVAYSLMLKDALAEVISPEIGRLADDLRQLASRNREVVIVGLTHGQPAVPTTLGKEFAVFVARIDRQREILANVELFAKFSGAVGSYNAHVLAYPDVDWQETCREFVESLGLRHSSLTTQVDSRDSLAEVMHTLGRTSAITVDCVRDIWMYGLAGYVHFLRDPGTVGSSTMPQKSNPIDFENAESNARISSTLLAHLGEALVISRLQRDLADSSAARNIAVALGHFLLALLGCRRGLSRLAVNSLGLDATLTDRWEMMAEATQTLLRKAGVRDAFELVSEVERSDGFKQGGATASARPCDARRPSKVRFPRAEGLPRPVVGTC